jgi:hypothetical protein
VCLERTSYRPVSESQLLETVSRMEVHQGRPCLLAGVVDQVAAKRSGSVPKTEQTTPPKPIIQRCL